jgi:hypothetical protein
MARHLPEPPVLVAARQSHLHAAVPGLLKHLKDTGFGEALGAGLFAFEPGLLDVGGSAARVLFGRWWVRKAAVSGCSDSMLNIKCTTCCSGRRIWQGRAVIFGCLDSAGRLVTARYLVPHPLQLIHLRIRDPPCAPSNERPSPGQLVEKQ